MAKRQVDIKILIGGVARPILNDMTSTLEQAVEAWLRWHKQGKKVKANVKISFDAKDIKKRK